MKSKIRTEITFLLLFLISFTSKAQIKNINKKTCYNNNKTSLFLKDIQLEIKAISYMKAGESNPYQIILRFDDENEINQLTKNKISSGRVTVQFFSDNNTIAAFNTYNDYGTVKDKLHITELLEKVSNLKVFRIYGDDDSFMK